MKKQPSQLYWFKVFDNCLVQLMKDYFNSLICLIPLSQVEVILVRCSAIGTR